VRKEQSPAVTIKPQDLRTKNNLLDSTEEGNKEQFENLKRNSKKGAPSQKSGSIDLKDEENGENAGGMNKYASKGEGGGT